MRVCSFSIEQTAAVNPLFDTLRKTRSGKTFFAWYLIVMRLLPVNGLLSRMEAFPCFLGIYMATLNPKRRKPFLQETAQELQCWNKEKVLRQSCCIICSTFRPHPWVKPETAFCIVRPYFSHQQQHKKAAEEPMMGLHSFFVLIITCRFKQIAAFDGWIPYWSFQWTSLLHTTSLPFYFLINLTYQFLLSPTVSTVHWDWVHKTVLI